MGAPVKKKTRSSALVALLAALAAVGCAAKQTPPSSAAAPAAKGDGLALDELALPPVVRFSKDDLDESKDACADLAGHVNDKWLAANELPGDRTSWGAFEVLDERSKAVQRQLLEQAAARPAATGVMKIVGDLWATGMDEDAVNAQGIKPLAARLAAIEALKDSEAIAEHLRATFARGEGSLFGFGPDADFKDSGTNIAYATQGGLGLPDKTYYFDEDKAAQREAYVAHIQKVLELSGVPAGAAKEQALDVMAFEKRLAKASRSREELSRDVSLWYNPLSLAEADALTPAFPWSRFFDAQGVAHPAHFSLAMPAFHAEVSTMLGELPVSHWQSYLRFHLVDEASPYLADAFVAEHYNFYKKQLRGQKEMEPRYKRVLTTVNGQTGEALGQLYVQVAFPASSKARMQELVNNLGEALKARLEGLEWMSAETKKTALEKWASFTPKIGYPDKWRDWSGLTTSRESYLGNVLAARAFNYEWELSKIGQPVDKSEWGMSPQTVNAYYNPLQNEIVFPAAILQPPFFDPDADDALNYGGIGAVIGHEMIHGYDDQGSRFGPTGNFEVWWTDDDAKSFSAKTERLVGQFNEYEAFPGGKVNGKLTLGENIADLGGLAVSYDAMKAAAAGKEDPLTEGLTREQRFFLNWSTVWRRSFTPDELKVRLATDSHAPATFRANGAPSNLRAFAEAFSCKSGDAMARDGEQRIVIW
jgi:putative endopeptidase